MRRFVAIALIAVASAAASGAIGPSDAEAAANVARCKAGAYQLVDPVAFPGVIHLRISMRRNAPYSGISSGAPKCLVAEAVAGLVQSRTSEEQRLPKTVTAMGARWYVGKFACRYETVWIENHSSQIQRTTCTHAGRYAATVRFDLTS